MNGKFISIFMIIVLLFALIGCSKNNKSSTDEVKNEILQEINVDNIQAITVSTQMTVPKKDIELKKEKWEKLLNKFNNFSLTKIDEEAKNGWQYMFKIEQDKDVIILISFMDGTVSIGENVYIVENYDAKEFLYLFE